MIRLLISTAAYLVANAVGLFVATLLLDGFRIDPLSFVVAVALFSAVQAVLSPLITKITFKNFPQLMGGIALVTIFIVLFITASIMPGMEIGGIANWLAATLLVWLGSLIATILLPIYVFKQLRERKRQDG
ncbi:phage holin family protein [Rhodosalinus sp. 5P4]|uniref:phage holin family protein n=1 Tax=Rhodosalinus sp. 5P4 TaxID=3239196 RepID=UPI0035263A6E